MPESGRKKKQTKDSQLVIRIPKADRDAFLDLCDALDTSAAREIRRFIREFADLHGASSEETSVTAPPSAKKVSKKQARRADNT